MYTHSFTRASKYFFPTFLLTITVCLLLLINKAEASKNYYFSNSSGDDSRTSTQAQSPSTPWKTITKLNSSTFLTGDSILLKRGDEWFETLKIQSSGSISNPIVIGSYGTGANPIISGFTTITSWTSEGNGIYSQTISIESSPNMLVINGINTAKGKYPSSGWLSYESYSGTNQITDNQLTGTQNWTGAEVIMKKNRWTIDKKTISVHSGTTITYTPSAVYGGINGFGYFFQNDLKCLTALGNWAYIGGKLYMYFGSNDPNSYAVKVSTLDKVISIQAKSYITIYNMTIEGGNVSCVDLDGGSSYISVQNCIIRNSGVSGIRIDNANHLTFNNLTITDCNSQGVYARYSSPYVSLTNSTINNIGLLHGMVTANIFGIISWSPNLTVTGNTFTNMGYCAITFDNNNALISNNYIDGFCKTTDDGAGIYTYIGAVGTTYTNRKVQNNIVINGIGVNDGTNGLDPNLAEGIYTDGYSKNVDVTGNTVANCGDAGIFVNCNDGGKFENNTVYNNLVGFYLNNWVGTPNPLRNITAKGNIFFAKTATQKPLLVRNKDNDFTLLGTFDNNYYCRPINDATPIYTYISTDGWSGVARSLATWRTMSGEDASSLNSPQTVSTASDILFDYNSTNINKVVALSSSYIDVKGTVYSNSITIPPYSSVVLIKSLSTGSNTAPSISNQSFQLVENSANGTIVGTIIATDVDAGQTKTFSILSGNTGNAFTINASTGVLTAATASAINFEVTPSFALVVKVQDNGTGALSSQATITVNLTDVNEVPVINNQLFSIAEHTSNSVNIGTILVSDPDVAQTKMYSIVSGNTNGAYSVNSSTGAISVANSAVIDYELTPTYSLTIKVQDNGTGSLSSQATITVSLTDVNEAPVINNQSFTIAENSANGSTTGTVSAIETDAGQILTYSIVSGNTNNAFAISATTGVLTVATSSACNFEVTPSFALIVKVQDNGTGALSSQATISISLIDINEAPVITNQLFSTAEHTSNAVNIGTVLASDPDVAQTKTYSIVSGNTNNAFSVNSLTGVLSVSNSAVIDYELTPSYSLTIKVQDNGTGSLSSQATITVSLTDVNEAPAINNQSFTIAENSANGSTAGTVSATETDAGQILTYSIVSGNTNNAFAINASTGVLSVATSSAINFEVTPSFALILKVQDNGTGTLNSQATINVSLTDINEAPIINSQSFSIAENATIGTIIGTVSATETDAGQALNYAIISGNTNGAFTINTLTGELTVANPAAIVYNINPTFTLNIRASDNGTGNLSNEAPITINVLQSTKKAPVINNQSFSIAENAINGSSIGTVLVTAPGVGQIWAYSILSGNTSNAFTINTSTGLLTVATSASINFEVTPIFTLIIKVQDNVTGTLSSQATITISLVNVNEAPVISNQSFTVAENSANATTIGTVVASDPDAGQTKTFSILSGNTNTAFAINASTGILSVASSSKLNFEVTPTFALVIKVQDNGTGTLGSQATITISLINVNEAPVISNQSFSIAENSANATTIGTVVASDPDAGQTKTFSILSGNTNAAYAIDASTGILSVASSTALNYESTPTFKLVIKVQDNGTGTLSSQATITISLVNVNEAPVISNQSFSIAENSANAITIGTVVATDPDAGQTKTFSILSGNTSTAFAINPSTGILSVASTAALNFEVTPTFTLVIKVQDNGTGTLTSQATITISLINVNEAPVISNQSFTVAENSANATTFGTVVASDPDAGQIKTFSILSGNTNTAFAINASTGILSVASSTALNFEVTPTFTLVIKVQDNGTGTLSSQASITVSLINVNEAPVISNQSFSIAENSVNATTIGTVVASDPDTGQTMTFSILSGNTDAAFAINASTGILSVVNSVALNFEVTPTFTMVVNVQDNGTGTLSSQASITVSMVNVNEAPVISNQSFSIAENTANSTTIGTVVASDPDAGQTKTFSILYGNTNSVFAIDPITGVLKVNNSDSLSFNITPAYMLLIKVQDNGAGNLYCQSIITISVLDIINAPSINDQSFSIVENSSKGSSVGAVVATDTEIGKTKTFSIISGNLNNAFAINSLTGELIVADSSLFDFEVTPTFTLGVNVLYNNTGNVSNNALITISLIDINEAPVMSNQLLSVLENSVQGTKIGFLKANDPDKGQKLKYMIVSGNDNHAFNLNDTSGLISVADPSKLSYGHNALISLTVIAQDNGKDSLSTLSIITINLLHDSTQIFQSIAETFSEKDISIYPNPTADIINIDLGKVINQPVNIRIFNMNGSEIFSSVSKGEKKVEIYLGDENPGVYIASLALNGLIYTKNIIVKN